MTEQPTDILNRLKSSWFFILCMLVFLNYGAIWSRGGYADDFAFLVYSHSQSYWDAVANWMTTYNSRVGQGLVMPFLLNIAKGEQYVSFNWWIIHGIGLICFVISIHFFSKILILFRLPQPIRYVAIIIFALHPLNVDVLFRPATIVGYVIPFSLFLIAIYLYLSLEKNHNPLRLTRILVFFLLLFAILSIEQLLPLMVIIFFIRFFVLSFTKRQLVESVFFTALSFTVFLYLAIAGNTAPRVEKFSTINLSSLPERAIEVIGASVSSYLLYPLKIVLDQFYWSSLLDIITSPLFWFSIILAIFLMQIISKLKFEQKYEHARQPFLFTGLTGALLWLGALSPLMVVSYYLPGRIFYIPLLGFSLLCGVVFYFVWEKASSPRLRVALLSSLALGIILSSMLNMHHQSEFSRYWNMEQSVIQALSENASAIPQGATVSLHNIPLEFGPVPSLIDDYTFPSLLSWMFPDKDLKGTTTQSLLSSLPTEIEGQKEAYLKNVANDNVVLFLWQDKVIRIINPNYLPIEEFSNFAPNSHHSNPYPWDKQISIERLALDISQKYSNGSALEVSSIMRINELDSLLVNVSVLSGKKRIENSRLQFHVLYRNDTKVPFDMSIGSDSGFIKNEESFHRDMLIPNLSEVSRVVISLGSSPDKTDNELKKILVNINGNEVDFVLR